MKLNSIFKRVAGLPQARAKRAWHRKLVMHTGLFDPEWYLARYPDVRHSGMDPVEHYLRYGAGEGRDPSPDFSTAAYRAAHPELAGAQQNYLIHLAKSRLRGFEALEYGGSINPAVAEVPITKVGADRARAQRVIIVTGEPETPGHIYRVERLSAALVACGFATRCTTIDELSRLAPLLAESVALIIWRAPWNNKLQDAVSGARRSHVKILFDVDDYMFDPALAQVDVIDGIRSQGFDAAEVAAHYHRVGETLRNADVCLCSTAALASAMRHLGKPTWVIPNGFDEDTYRRSRLAALAKRAASPDGLIRLGYAAGSRTHQRDFAQASASVARLLRERPNCRLVLFRRGAARTLDHSEFTALAGLEAQIEWREFVPLRDLPDEIARFDINLAPLEVGNPFVEAKSELKYVEAALAGVPTVASPTGPYRKAMQDGVTGFLASDAGKWDDILSQLTDDPCRRHEVARNALLDVIWRFGPEQRSETVACVMNEVLASGAEAARHVQLRLLRNGRSDRQLPVVEPADVVFAAGLHGHSAVAVIIPLHNYEHYVTEALESIRQQTLTDIDVIVVDDCSTDRSLVTARAWLERHQDRFRYVALLRNRRNIGLGPTRNVAFDHAEAPLIMCLDADNKLLPECLFKCEQRLRESGAAMAYPTIQTFGDIEQLMGTAEWSASRLACGPYIDAMALVRKSAWAAVGGYQNVRNGWEDYDFWCRFVEHGLWGARVPEVLALYRKHGKSMTVTQTAPSENLNRLMADFRIRYPWLDLPDGQPIIQAVSPVNDADTISSERASAACGSLLGTSGEIPLAASPDQPPLPTDTNRDRYRPRSHNEARVRELLTILRCPISREPLTVTGTNELSNISGNIRWPMRNGVPVLFPGLNHVVENTPSHVSNPIPARAKSIIERTDGLVLNLSAGGTDEWHPHVIEVEAALFRNTDIVADSHSLPFTDQSFASVISLNAFEHYGDPRQVAAEIRRVLRPGGILFVHTAFMQPLHEAPWHFYNCTKYGLLNWFADFDTPEVTVSDNFHPGHSVAWLCSELEQALREGVSANASRQFSEASVARLCEFWRRPEARNSPLWQSFSHLPQSAQERTAAGFQLVARRSLDAD